MASAPASSSPRINSTVRSTSGYPAVMYGTSARRFCARSSANRRAMTSDEIVANPDAIPLWVFGLDDRAKIHAVRVSVGQIGEHAWMRQVAERVGDDAHDRAREHV